MSSPAPSIRPAPSRLAPWRTGSRPAGLTVVPEARRRAPRFPFIALVSVLLVGGVVGLLMFNTSMQQAAFTESELQEQATNLAAREETMAMELLRMQDPQNVAKRARQLGMVIPATSAMLDVTTGKVLGEPRPADRSATPPLYPRMPAPARPRTTQAPPTPQAQAEPSAGDRQGTGDAATSQQAPERSQQQPAR